MSQYQRCVLQNAEYAIFNFWNFPEGLGLKVKVGEYSPRAPCGRELSLSEELIEWATGKSHSRYQQVSDLLQTPHSVCSESCSPGFRKTPQKGKATCCFDCTPCPENEIFNETDRWCGSVTRKPARAAKVVSAIL
uniref:GPCR family 3 nine cysteines domain-containing protein n=1 Tax=Equus asinus TaxID=9793 RepID=A0A8C4M4N9_EQUAS